VRYFLVQAFAPLFMRKKKTLLPFGPLLLPLSAMVAVAAVAEWANSRRLMEGLVGPLHEALGGCNFRQAGGRSRWCGGAVVVGREEGGG